MKNILFALAALVCLIFSQSAYPAASAPPAKSWEEMEAAAPTLTFSGLDRAGVSLLLGSSQRLVVDTAHGIAVAEVLEHDMARLSALRVDRRLEGAGADGFAREVAAVFPAFRPEMKENRGYIIKKPSAKVIKDGPKVQKRAPSEGGRPEVTCFYEGFEQLPIWWEDGGNWFHYEADHANNEGDYFWLDVDCDHNYGSWSASAVMGGDYGIDLYCDDTYDYYTDSWMKYAYFIDCASGWSSASLSFAMRLQTEANYDTFGYYASIDDYDYWGYEYSGDYADYWYEVVQNLKSWYHLGDITDYPDFALAFNFYSDDQGQVGFGAYLDDISIDYDVVGIDSVLAMKGPFRLKVYGGSFQPGAWIYIDGVAVPRVIFKNQNLIVAKGGAYLKSMVPIGKEVCVQVINPGGETTPCYDFIRY